MDLSPQMGVYTSDTLRTNVLYIESTCDRFEISRFVCQASHEVLFRIAKVETPQFKDQNFYKSAQGKVPLSTD